MAVDDVFLRALRDWERDQARGSAAQARRSRDTAAQLEWEEATFTGFLVDAFEARTVLRFEVHGNRAHTGMVAALGADCVVIDTERGAVILRLTAISSVVLTETLRQAPSNRLLESRFTLIGLLAETVLLRPVLRIYRSQSEAAVTGELQAVSANFLTLTTTTAMATTVVLPLAHIDEVQTP